MARLWEEKENGKEYSWKRISIAKTFGNYRKKILCYERLYSKLEEEQLIELLKDARENEWDVLDLSNCGLSKLPDELWEISSLKVLYLGNYFEEEENTFSELSEKIEKLEALEALSICGIQGLKIPNSLRKLPNLVYLDCFGCSMYEIPNNLLNGNIRAIGIECDNMEQSAKICGLKKLEELFLTHSKVKELPVEIGELKSLKTLHIIDSQIEIIPESLLNLRQLVNFRISNTPLENKVPEEMKRQTAHEVISYICRQQKQQGAYFFNESKMIIVGQGNVGKSCLLERITNNKYEEKDSTEGIDVKKWTYNKDGRNYKLNIWDFGGQEIYHSTHQFFLTKRSLYIFVWDARAEEEYGRIDYWLKTIESFADDSPIIVCINKCDKNTTRINRIDFKEYKEKYPQIDRILDISCKDNIHISRLRNIIKQLASNLQITKEKWLKSWYDVRHEIEKKSEKRKYITYDEYIDMCRKHNIDLEEAKSLSKYLHDLGVILHYQDDYFLKSIVILSPEWATSAVYKILDSQEGILRGRNGVLYLKDLPFIWSDREMFPEDKYIFLLKIMEKFQLCFGLDRERYLVAELLENTSIDIPKGWDFNSKSCIRLVYRYDFMPAGVMTRFIVKIHDYIAVVDGKDMCWKKGVYLKYKSAYARVVMKDNVSEKKIEVSVNKRENSSYERELLHIIRKTLWEINENFKKIHVEEYVPCNCSIDCNFQFPYDSLCKALDKRVETIQCHNSFEHVNILKLLEGIDIMRPEEVSPYNISIQNNPVISNHVSFENNLTQESIINIKDVRNIIMDIQGDIAEMKDDVFEEIEDDKQKEIIMRLEKINDDLEKIGQMNTEEQIKKSGKVNKLKRWLIEFSDKDSELRKSLSGVKSIMTIASGVITKFNGLAEKLGIDKILPI